MSDAFQYKAGLHNVGSYQVSGYPFVTGSLTAPTASAAPLEITFPSLTQRIQVLNTGGTAVKVGFSANGVSGSGTNYYLVQEVGAGKENHVELRVKTNKLFIQSSGASATGIYLEAELTGITGYDLAAALTGAAGIG